MVEPYIEHNTQEIYAEISLQQRLAYLPASLLPEQPLKVTWIHNIHERNNSARYILQNGTTQSWGYRRIKEALTKGYFVSHSTEQIYINQPEPRILLDIGYGHDMRYESDQFDENYRVQQSDLDRATFTYSFQTLGAATANQYLNNIFTGRDINVAESILGRSIFAEMLYPGSLIFSEQRHGNGAASSLADIDTEHSKVLSHLIRTKGSVNNLYGWMPFNNIILPAAYIAAAEANGFDRLLKNLKGTFAGKESFYSDLLMDLTDFALAQTMFDKVFDNVLGKRNLMDEFYTRLEEIKFFLAWNKGFFAEMKLTQLQAIVSTIAECVQSGCLSEDILTPSIKGKFPTRTATETQRAVADRYKNIRNMPFEDKLDFLEAKVGQVVQFMSRIR